jgi:hypothetical protein
VRLAPFELHPAAHTIVAALRQDREDHVPEAGEPGEGRRIIIVKGTCT